MVGVCQISIDSAAYSHVKTRIGSGVGYLLQLNNIQSRFIKGDNYYGPGRGQERMGMIE